MTQSITHHGINDAINATIHLSNNTTFAICSSISTTYHTTNHLSTPFYHTTNHLSTLFYHTTNHPSTLFYHTTNHPPPPSTTPPTTIPHAVNGKGTINKKNEKKLKRRTKKKKKRKEKKKKILSKTEVEDKSKFVASDCDY
jgi:hypothetical protein